MKGEGEPVATGGLGLAALSCPHLGNQAPNRAACLNYTYPFWDSSVVPPTARLSFSPPKDDKSAILMLASLRVSNFAPRFGWRMATQAARPPMAHARGVGRFGNPLWSVSTKTVRSSIVRRVEESPTSGA